MKVVLISTYELGHQPFGIASPAACLRDAGASVTTADVSLSPLPSAEVIAADLVCVYVPMHTASRIAASLLPVIRRMSPRAHVCCYGLYAPVNERYLRSIGADTILGGEFESGLVSLMRRLRDGAVSPGEQLEPVISLDRQPFVLPDRSGLPPLERYASLLVDGGERVVGYTEATRGCRHLCRHCPVVPVYGGRFRAVPREVVLGDIRQQVAAGAQHVTFGDPDFFNGPGHALPIVHALHDEHPQLTYDVTIKVEHLHRHARHLPALRDTGCLFVTSAVESVDDAILERFDKRHTREQFVAVVHAFREVGLELAPTFVTFTPWTTLDGYLELLETIRELDLVANVAPIQYAIRLLIPAGSRLLELDEVSELVKPFDDEALLYPWTHADPRVDRLHSDVLAIVEAAGDDEREATFAAIRRLARAAAGLPDDDEDEAVAVKRRTAVPHLSEPWYCCAEPTEQQVCVDNYLQAEVTR
jgi:radical SAM superfamily enzyme YgiQ (UPF0313 family)